MLINYTDALLKVDNRRDLTALTLEEAQKLYEVLPKSGSFSICQSPIICNNPVMGVYQWVSYRLTDSIKARCLPYQITEQALYEMLKVCGRLEYQNA